MASEPPSLRRQFEAAVAPLEAEEERRAVAAAVVQLDRPEQRRFRVLGAELLIDKPRRLDAAPERRIDVIVVDYDARRIVEVVVDGEGEVVDHDELAYQPAFHPDEVGEAYEIAVRDERVARLAQLQEAAVSTFAPEVDAERGTRLVGLRFAVVEQEEVRYLANVAVDLCARAVLSFEDVRTGGGG